MHPVSENIRKLVLSVRPALLQISPETAGSMESPGRWSKKEILGHLIDSASNNHQRIVRAAQNSAMEFPPYSQTQWVNVQHYAEMEWNDLVELFCAYNMHLSRIIGFLPQGVFKNPCNIGRDDSVPLQFIVEDYLRHLTHHVCQIIETAEIS